MKKCKVHIQERGEYNAKYTRHCTPSLICKIGVVGVLGELGD